MALFAAAFCHAQNATITGTVKDGDMNDFLIGASVFVEGTAHGTIADANGSYNLSVPYGKVTVCCDFLGYKPQEIELELEAGEVRTLNITMYSDSEVLEGVVVSAQAKGQAAAINSQINAAGIINAVSEEKLSELPDVNVADAIGRLPGLMIQRDGGEGQKIIIRGLAPKYNTVAINGMSAPSTSSTDRSTDLNMISPDMIAGAEVLKANTADKDADGLQDLFSSGTESGRDNVKDEASPGRTIASCGNVMEKNPMPPQKKITEIRVFYDDNTFDVFFPAK